MWNSENVSPQRGRAALRELRRLAARPPPGVKLLLRDDDLTDIVALIEGPAETPYSGGVFRVRLALGREFPASPPRAYFLTRIFHPNVGRGGEVCVNTLKRDWRPELGLEHALLALRCLLIAPNADSALNADAAAMLRGKYDEYFARAKLLTEIHARPARAHDAGDQDDNASSIGGGAEEPAEQEQGQEQGGAEEPAEQEQGQEQGGAEEPAEQEQGQEQGGAETAAGAEWPRAKRSRPRGPRDKRRVLKRL